MIAVLTRIWNRGCMAGGLGAHSLARGILTPEKAAAAAWRLQETQRLAASSPALALGQIFACTSIPSSSVRAAVSIAAAAAADFVKQTCRRPAGWLAAYERGREVVYSRASNANIRSAPAACSPRRRGRRRERCIRTDGHTEPGLCSANHACGL